MTEQKTLFKDDPAIGPDREYQQKYMSERRRRERDVLINKSRINRRRRARCKPNPKAFCRTYFPDIFYNPFTSDQKQIIEAIKQRLLFGGRQAIAAERGGGKTSMTQIVAGVWGIVYGYVDYLVILRANGDEAAATLATIKHYFESNELLRDDFPEICDPILALEGSAQRARAQTVDGVRTYLKWGTREVHFPAVKGSAASGAVVVSRGVDAAIRGLVKEEKRPKLVICDDIETRASAESVVETKRRKQVIERDVMGLAGPGKEMAVIILCTIINRRCLAYQYTDRKKNPQWNGIRQQWIKKMPSNIDLWERYVEKRREDLIAGDMTARKAHRYYERNRKAMDAGAVVSNKKRFIKKLLDDKSWMEISSIQSAYNLIADMGWESFSCEYQNDPPEEEQIETIGLSPRIIMNRCAGIPRGIVPAWCEYLTAGIDIGRRLVHWSVIGWSQGMRGHIIDYGVEPVHSPDGDHKDQAVQKQIADAILITLLRWRDWEADNGWAPEVGGESRHLDIACVDAGWVDTAVYSFCRSTINRKYRPTKGFGTMQKTKFRQGRPSATRRSGHHWIGSWQADDKIWLFHVDADYWKQVVQGSFLLDPGQLGSMTIFGDDKIQHSEFGRQICAETWTREFKTGVGFIEGFRQHYRHNHFLDTVVAAAVAANMRGVKLMTVDTGEKPGRKISLKKIQELKRAGKL